MNDAFKKFDLTGKAAYVTGGSAGLGYHMARALAQSGAKVMIAARREDVLKESAKRLTDESSGDKVLYQSIDLADPVSIRESSQAAISELGGVDIFVGNAGVDVMELLGNMQQQTNERMFQVNVLANMALTQLFLPHMRKKKWGRIIFSSSVVSKVSTPFEGFSAYSAVKGAINAFTRNAAAEVGNEGITVNSVIIGMFLTDMVKAVLDAEESRDETLRDMIGMHALGRLGEPEEVEGVIQLLASDAGSYITGGEIPLDGGITIMMRPNKSSF